MKVRDNIGLIPEVQENILDNIKKKVKQDFAKRKQLFGKGKTA